MEQGQARGRGELRAFRPRPCCFSYRGVFLLLSCQPSSHIPSADQLPRAPIPPLPRSVPVTAVLWGYVASTALSRGSPYRRSLAGVQGLGEQRRAAACSFSPAAPPAGPGLLSQSAGFGAGDCGRRAQAPLEKPFRVRTPGTRPLARGTLGCGISPAAPYRERTHGA